MWNRGDVDGWQARLRNRGDRVRGHALRPHRNKVCRLHRPRFLPFLRSRLASCSTKPAYHGGGTFGQNLGENASAERVYKALMRSPTPNARPTGLSCPIWPSINFGGQPHSAQSPPDAPSARVDPRRQPLLGPRGAAGTPRRASEQSAERAASPRRSKPSRCRSVPRHSPKAARPPRCEQLPHSVRPPPT